MKTTQEILDFYGIEIGKKYKITKFTESINPELLGKIFFLGQIFAPENLQCDTVVLHFSESECSAPPISLLNYIEYEEVTEILDDKEKDYLRNVIKPFRKDVVSIIKHKCPPSYFDKEFIEIWTRDDEFISFPLFEKGTMYKGMKTDVSYTLEELGL